MSLEPFTLNSYHWQPPPPFLKASSLLQDNLKEEKKPEPYTGSSTAISEPNDDLKESKDSWDVYSDSMEIPLTLSECEALLKNASSTSPKTIPLSDSDSDLEDPPFLNIQEKIPSNILEEVEQLRTWQKIPHGMTCCCDYPYIASRNCNFWLTRGRAIRLSHLFAKSTLALQAQGNPGECFKTFQTLIRSHLANGGTIITAKRRSFWMILMEASFSLVISNDGLTAIPSTLKSKEAMSQFSPLVGSSLPMSIHHTGGLLSQLEEMAETLYGAALQEYIITKNQAHRLLSMTTPHYLDGK